MCHDGRTPANSAHFWTQPFRVECVTAAAADTYRNITALLWDPHREIKTLIFVSQSSISNLHCCMVNVSTCHWWAWPEFPWGTCLTFTLKTWAALWTQRLMASAEDEEGHAELAVMVPERFTAVTALWDSHSLNDWLTVTELSGSAVRVTEIKFSHFNVLISANPNSFKSVDTRGRWCALCGQVLGYFLYIYGSIEIHWAAWYYRSPPSRHVWALKPVQWVFSTWSDYGLLAWLHWLYDKY